MHLVNEMKLVFASKSLNESFARTTLAAFVASLDPTISELADIKTAVSEAVTNSIVHAYKDIVGLIYVTAQIYSNGKIIIKIRDRGSGIENVKKAMEPLFTTGGEERAGLGFAVMQSFMDKIRVNSKLGKGTTVTMEKILIPRGGSAQKNDDT